VSSEQRCKVIVSLGQVLQQCM